MDKPKNTKTVRRKLPNNEVCKVEVMTKPYELEMDEKEIIIRYDFTNPNAIIYSSDKKTSTQFKKIKNIKVVEETKYGTTFELPKSEIKIGTTARVRKTVNVKKTK